MNIQKIKNYLNKHSRLKSFLKKTIVASPFLKEFISKRYGILRAPYSLENQTIRLGLCNDKESLSLRARIIYKDISCLAKETK